VQLKPKALKPEAPMPMPPKAPPPKTAIARRRLMAASCALLGAGAARSQQTPAASPGDGFLEDWSVDSALAYYHEEGRIEAVEPVVEVAKVFADGQSLTLNVTFDALSGASPNGALTSHTAQTFASPSGKPNHRYTVAPGQLPVDADYQDDRIAVGGNWSVPITRVDQVSVGAKISGEDDFYSATVNAMPPSPTISMKRTPRCRSASTTSLTPSTPSAMRPYRGAITRCRRSKPEARRRTALAGCSASPR
jgi:hypothetical protein